MLHRRDWRDAFGRRERPWMPQPSRWSRNAVGQSTTDSSSPPSGGDRSCGGVGFQDQTPTTDPTGSSKSDAPVTDDATESSTRSRPQRRRPAGPGWLTGDGVLDIQERQTLVVGAGLAGLTVTSLLEAAGYEPILVGETAPATPSEIVCLDGSTLGVFDAMGLGPEVRESGQAVRSLVVSGGESVSLDSQEGSMLTVAVPTGDLRALLKSHLPDRVRHRTRQVSSLTRDDGTLAVRFEDGVEEFFDIVIDAGGELRQRPATESWCDTHATLVQREAIIETNDLEATEAKDCWHDDVVTQLVLHPSASGHLLRMTADSPEVLADAWACRRRVIAGQSTDETDAQRQTTVQQVHTLKGIDRASWGDGFVPRCGPSVLRTAPASGLCTPLAVGDAWVLADELVRGPSSTAAAIETYTRRRYRWLRRLLETDAEPSERRYPVPDVDSQALSAVGRYRRARFCGRSTATDSQLV